MLLRRFFMICAWKNLTICESLWMSVCFLMRQYFISVACWTCITEKCGLTSHLMKSLNNVKTIHWKWLYSVAWWRIASLGLFFLKKKNFYVLPDEVDWIWMCPGLAFIVTRPNITDFFLWVYIKNIIIYRDSFRSLDTGTSYHWSDCTSDILCLRTNGRSLSFWWLSSYKYCAHWNMVGDTNMLRKTWTFLLLKSHFVFSL